MKEKGATERKSYCEEGAGSPTVRAPVTSLRYVPHALYYVIWLYMASVPVTDPINPISDTLNPKKVEPLSESIRKNSIHFLSFISVIIGRIAPINLTVLFIKETLSYLHTEIRVVLCNH